MNFTEVTVISSIYLKKYLPVLDKLAKEYSGFNENNLFTRAWKLERLSSVSVLHCKSGLSPIELPPINSILGICSLYWTTSAVVMENLFTIERKTGNLNKLLVNTTLKIIGLLEIPVILFVSDRSLEINNVYSDIKITVQNERVSLFTYVEKGRKKNVMDTKIKWKLGHKYKVCYITNSNVVDAILALNQGQNVISPSSSSSSSSPLSSLEISPRGNRTQTRSHSALYDSSTKITEVLNSYSSVRTDLQNSPHPQSYVSAPPVTAESKTERSRQPIRARKSLDNRRKTPHDNRKQNTPERASSKKRQRKSSEHL